MKLESLNNSEANEMEVYARLVRGMSDVDLEQAFEELQETQATLSHDPTFSNSFFDLTSLKAFKAGINPQIKLAETEQKLGVLRAEMDRRGILETM